MFKRIESSYYSPQRLADVPDGIGWSALRDETRQAVENAQSIEEVRQALSAALDALGESHFAILPAEAYGDIRGDALTTAADAPKKPGSVGVHVRFVDDGPIVSSVDRGSSAEAAGVRAGWLIQSIDGQDIRDGAARLRAALGDHPLTQVRLVEWIESQLLVEVGQSVALGLLDTSGEPHVVRLQSRSQPGLWASFGYLPAMNLRYSASRLPGEIGYFSLSVFLNPPQVMPTFGQFVSENLDARGIIIDLRGNPGGLGAMATGMCGFFIPDEGRRIGAMLRRDGNLLFVINPRYPQYGGPVAVLIDEMSLSTSEILAGGLQEVGRARLFGQPTPGAALPSTVVRLANGDSLQYVLADFVLASGKRLEGKGITPDTLVPLDRRSLEAGKDDVLDAACKWILEQEFNGSKNGMATAGPSENR